jgi:monofunctional biosynthetic peptidoglycan transglycosylase
MAMRRISSRARGLRSLPGKRWASRFILWLVALTLVSTFLLRFVPPPLTPLMVIRGIQGMTNGSGFVIRKRWQPLKNISPAMVQAVIAAEDQKFLRHSGFDLQAISKAYAGNRAGKKQKGASTISQQTAKNVFLWPASSYFRKAIEVYFTLLLELLWDKERIIEVYLNVAEFGPGIYGVESAARIYYGKSARQLTAREAAMLAAVLPAPRRWNAARPTPYLLQRRQWIMRQMRNVGPIDLN